MTINRWILRKQRKLIVVGSVFLMCLLIYTVTLHENIRIDEKHFQPFSERCRTGSASDLIMDICRNYTNGTVYGLLCEDLCLHKSILIEDCIHHGSTYVLVGKNMRKHDEIVLKRKRHQDVAFIKKYFEEFVQEHGDINQIRGYFLNSVADEIQSSHGHDSKVFFLQNIASVSKNIFGKNISELSLSEMRNSWQLVGQDELMVLALHQNIRAFPKLKGTCGDVYSIERITPYSNTFPELIPSLSWYKRVRIALGFLELIKQFHKSDVGPLHHCDVQEGNFGLNEDLTVKAIDVDLVYSVDRINEILPQPTCSSDEECDFFDCHSQCDVVVGHCTKKQITNNLQVVCRDVFLTHWSGLLTNFQPPHVNTKLNSLLKDCESKSFGLFPMNHSNVWNMVKDLEAVLHESLQHKV